MGETARKTFKYTLKPTPEQDRALESVVWHCRALYNTGLEQRRTWWERGQSKSATYHQQKAELPDLKVACSEYAEITAQVLQDVLLRLDRTFQAFFRRVSRRKKGSRRRRKAIALLKRKHQKVQRQRRDFHHKTALTLLRQYDTIYLEDLRVANMVRISHLAKSISDAGWAAFRTTLDAKAACAGRRVIAVPAHYTSQDCSGCGVRVDKTLSVRTHACPSCGLVIDRDENAALNILRAGQARQARTWAGTPSVA